MNTLTRIVNSVGNLPSARDFINAHTVMIDGDYYYQPDDVVFKSVIEDAVRLGGEITSLDLKNIMRNMGFNCTQAMASTALTKFHTELGLIFEHKQNQAGAMYRVYTKNPSNAKFQAVDDRFYLDDRNGQLSALDCDTCRVVLPRLTVLGASWVCQDCDVSWVIADASADGNSLHAIVND